MNNRKFRNWLKRDGWNATWAADADRIQDFLNGERDMILYSFEWVSMPQGGEFWNAIYDGAKISKRTRRFLAKLRDEARRRGC